MKSGIAPCFAGYMESLEPLTLGMDLYRAHRVANEDVPHTPCANGDVGFLCLV